MNRARRLHLFSQRSMMLGIPNDQPSCRLGPNEESREGAASKKKKE
jgi:hypothetical protein